MANPNLSIVTHLQPNDQPRLPFSSPIREEISFPTSPTESTTMSQELHNQFSSLPSASNASITLSRTTGIGSEVSSLPDASTSLAVEAARLATRNAGSRHARAYSVHKLARDKSRKVTRKNTKRLIPGISVVTDVSRHQGPNPAIRQQIDMGARAAQTSRERTVQLPKSSGAQTSKGGQGQNGGGFVSLADLKAVDGSKTPNGVWKPVLGDDWSQKMKARSKDLGDKRAGKTKAAGSSDGSPKKGKTFSFKTRTFRQRSKGPEDDIWEEDETPILAETEPENSSSTFMEDDDNEYILDVDSSNQRPTHLMPSPTKTDEELSPSDRPIVIGLSIPSAKLSEFAFSPESATGNMSNLASSQNGHRRNISDFTMTPTIIVTPASERPGYNPFKTDQMVKGRPRSRSSVYSPYSNNIPPLPSLPLNISKSNISENSFEAKSNVSRDSVATVFEEDEDFKPKDRGVSTCTVFEEDESPTESGRERHVPGENGIRALKRSSTDTFTTRHRSLGWWNYIVTPFLTRSNTNATLRHDGSVNSDKERPEVPSLAQAAAIVSQQNEMVGKNWEKEYSPVTPDSARAKSGHTTIWTDLSPDSVGPKSGHTTVWTDLSMWAEERDRIGIAIDHTPRASIAKSKVSHRTQGSSATIPVMMLGGLADNSGQYEGYEGGSDIRDLAFGASSSQGGLDHILNPNDPTIPSLIKAINQEARQSPVIHGSPRADDNQSDRKFAFTRDRADSEGTDIEDDSDLVVAHDGEDTPIRGAAATMGFAVSTYNEHPAISQKHVSHLEKEAVYPPPYSPPREAKFAPNLTIFPPVRTTSAYQQPHSPGPVSPGMNQILTSRGAIPMANVPRIVPVYPPPPTQRAARAGFGNQGSYMAPRAVPVTLTDLERPSDARRKVEAKRQRREKEDALGRKVGGLWRGRGCISSNGCFGRGGAEGRKRRRCFVCLTVSLILMIVLIVVLAMTLHRKPRSTAASTGPQWLNLTGFPPIPTGINTIIQPDSVSEVTSCIFPSTLWSCALPKEIQQSVAPNNPNQPNFKLQILYRNDSLANSSAAHNSKSNRRAAMNAVSAGSFARRSIHSARDTIMEIFWRATPHPPSIEEQRFMGNTTDNIRSSLKEGEATPFYITFLGTVSNHQKLAKRANSTLFPNLTAGIPQPSLSADGTAAPANLLPLPVQQPIRLYDRGLSTEHYGFYNYFDRSIFLKSTALLNQSDITQGPIADDENGGATESEARFRCTWAETRFLVQIWTNLGNQPLITATNASTGARISTSTSPPGTFPYPVTITMDRHGGNATAKKVYCYGMDLRERIVVTDKTLALENRGFGGTLVGGGQGPLGDRITISQGGLGGIDGGTGGCQCQWKNFRG